MTSVLGPVQTSHFCRVEFNANYSQTMVFAHLHWIRRDRNATFELGLRHSITIVYCWLYQLSTTYHSLLPTPHSPLPTPHSLLSPGQSMIHSLGPPMIHFLELSMIHSIQSTNIWENVWIMGGLQCQLVLSTHVFTVLTRQVKHCMISGNFGLYNI